jgi:hypothetical protein
MNENTYVDLWWVKMDVNKQYKKIKRCYSNQNLQKLESNQKHRRIIWMFTLNIHKKLINQS